MPFQPVAATAQVELVQLLDGQTVENTLYFRQDASFSAGELLALATAASGWWATYQAAYLSADIALQRVVATALHAQTGPQAIFTPTEPIPGEVGVDSVPNNVAACVSFRTNLLGRAFRGRNYVAGLPETGVQGSALITETQEALVAAYGQLLSGLSGAAWVVVTRTVNHVVQEPTALTNLVTSAILTVPFVRSQRRRLPNIGI